MSAKNRTEYIIYGSEYSPFSVKVRSYFRYKNIPHEWRVRTKDNLADFQKHAKLPLVPLVLSPDGTSMQDSTPIIETLETVFAEPSIYPDSVEMLFLSALLEEYGDEWGNKPMFHYRWWREPDQKMVAHGLAVASLPGREQKEIDDLADQIRQRMIPRLRFVGSSEQNKDVIEHSLERQLHLLEAHFQNRSYLFGERPSLGDFGIWGQLYSCTLQPTTKDMIYSRYPKTHDWINLMLDPLDKGDWHSWEQLAPSLMPFLKTEVGALFLPWSVANAKALFAEKPSFTVELEGHAFTQETQKYHARSLSVLKKKLAAIENRASVETILIEAGCFAPLMAEYW